MRGTVAGMNDTAAYLDRITPRVIRAHLATGRLDAARCFAAFTESDAGRSFIGKWLALVDSFARGDFDASNEALREVAAEVPAAFSINTDGAPLFAVMALKPENMARHFMSAPR
jgi:hypothetical protein